jgi:phosphopantothenoylcysteine decarboxylase/phosphopantothenate--cysteine ligase
LVETALEMRRAVLAEARRADFVVMTAAVSDWRVKKASARKIKRGISQKTLELVENPDIIAEIGRKRGSKVLVGFALETEKLAWNAAKKLIAKRLDLVVANRLGKKSEVFGNTAPELLIVDRFGNKEVLKRARKSELAKIIVGKMLKLSV